MHINEKNLKSTINKIEEKRQELVQENKNLLQSGKLSKYDYNCAKLEGITYTLERFKTFFGYKIIQ